MIAAISDVTATAQRLRLLDRAALFPDPLLEAARTVASAATLATLAATAAAFAAATAAFAPVQAFKPPAPEPLPVGPFGPFSSSLLGK